MIDRCPVCRTEDHLPVLTLPPLPIALNAQMRPAEAVDAARGVIELVVCTGCGHLYNRAFDASLLDYDAAYENTLHYSNRFQEFARDLATRLVSEHIPAGGRVAELGSGPGHFLTMLCEAGVAEAFGFDPSYDPQRLGAPTHERVSISTHEFPRDGTLPVDLALSQHVLEHLADPVAALEAQRAAVAARGGVVYSEVPNGRLMIDQCALWDLIYEHPSYFVPSSLRLACERAGMSVAEMNSSFGGQFLWALAELDGQQRGDASQEVVGDTVERAVEFGEHARRRLESARDELEQFATSGPVVVWGAGSKGMTYLNLVADGDMIASVIDVNPRKHGWGVPGTGFSVTGPDSLADIRPSTVLVVNPVYVDEIGAELRDRGVADADVVALWS